jgi:uncharacterized protein YjbI with pentapeptide repeats
MAAGTADRISTHEGCGGVCLPKGGGCWAHGADIDQLPALDQLGEDGRLDASGVPITTELLQRLLSAAPKDDQGRPILAYARFNKAIFQGDAEFTGVTFHEARFGGATFEGAARFDGVTFRGITGLERVTFEGPVRFDGATFEGPARFDEATFRGTAWFPGATFEADTRFDRATFRGAAWFNMATFQADTWFDRATFGALRFNGASFRRTQQLGPMLVLKGLVLDWAVFHERAQIEVAAAAVCCRRARFLAGVDLGVRWARVMLDEADLSAPSLLAGVPDPFPVLKEEGRWAQALERLKRLDQRGPEGSRPRLVSVRRADVAGLTVARMDLRACRFVGAHHLDQLRVEESDFPATPRGWRWTTRQVVAEEHHWRNVHPHPATALTSSAGQSTPGVARSVRAGRRAGWYQPAHWPPAWLEVELPTPAQIAAAYRALRKGREDNKDEPGAADFYYGEMEMRRHAKRAQIRREHRRDTRGTASSAAIEYAILWLYWAVSGYGLRAWRALATLAAVVLLAGGIFAFWGFDPPPEPAFRIVDVDAAGAPIYERQPSRQRPAGLDELPGAVRFSAQAATALLRGPDRPLTGLGEWLHMALRLVGPVLLGLAVLSIRGRVKR